jgi:8-oxo-dGTP pyrophosphatase MutT (NUDIX family)
MHASICVPAVHWKEVAMPRAQSLVHRENRVLMVQHRQHGQAWWCLPGGAVEPGEAPSAAALRELAEECCVRGRIVRQLSHLTYGPGDESYTFLVEIGQQEPVLGSDPDVAPGQEVLSALRWLALDQIPERDRAFLWAAGLLAVMTFFRQVEAWGDALSYPV